jgi:hypothetical protein
MVLAERLAAGFGDDQPFVIGWRDHLLSARVRTGALARRVWRDSPTIAVHRGRAYLGCVMPRRRAAFPGQTRLIGGRYKT